MQVMYNVTGAERKKLVTAISEVLGYPANYKGAPTFQYEVGDYTIDKHGTLIIPPEIDFMELGYFFDQLAMKGFVGEMYEADEPDAEPPTSEALESTTPEVQADAGAATMLTIEIPLEGFADTQLLNLEKLVASKASLIKKSLGIAALPIEKTEYRLTFPWFDRELNSFEIKTYTHFIGALCETAKKQKRVTATDKPVDSERFAFRIFLLKLGFAGPEYADERKLLYQNLTGDCAFNNTTKRDEHAERWKNIRTQRRLASEAVEEASSDNAATEPQPEPEPAPESSDGKVA